MNKSKGNMYGFVEYTVNPIGGVCSHKCSYCSIESLKDRFPNVKNKYSGKPRIVKGGLKEIRGKGKTIFVASATDLFAKNVEINDILAVLNKCSMKGENKYLFQTKNPGRLLEVHKTAIKDNKYQLIDFIPQGSIIVVTVESDIMHGNFMGNTPHPVHRMEWLELIEGFTGTSKRKNTKINIRTRKIYKSSY